MARKNRGKNRQREVETTRGSVRSKRGSPNRGDREEYTEYCNQQNQKAMSEGPTKKRWTKHDLKATVETKRPVQREFLQAYFQGDHICAFGSAGTGKTYLATYLAINDCIDPDKKHERVIFVRSAVATRDVGHLPGTLEEKTALYEAPYKDIMTELFGRDKTYDDMKERGLIEFMPTSFIRGQTWNDAVILIDEMQNMTFHEISSIMTRVGKNSRIIATGDLRQTDLNKSKHDQTGMDQFLKIAARMEEFTLIEFTRDDIVRSEFAKSWIIATETEEEESAKKRKAPKVSKIA